MGTHPIFESDFDCLTENVEQNRWRLGVCRRNCPNIWLSCRDSVAKLTDTLSRNRARIGTTLSSLLSLNFAPPNPPLFCQSSSENSYGDKVGFPASGRSS